MWDSAAIEAMRLSVRISAVSTCVIAIAGTPFALWISRTRNIFSRAIEAFLFLPFVIPPVVTGYLLMLLFSPKYLLGRWMESIGLRFSLDWKGAIVASSVLAFPLFMAVAKAAFEGVDRKLEDAAKMLNANSFRAFFTVTFPLALPGLLAATGLAFARAFGEFGATMMLAGNIPGQTRTVPQAIYSHLLAGREEAAWILVLVSIGVGLASMFLAQHLAGQRLNGSAKGNSSA